MNTNESTESTVVNEPAQKKGRGRPRREAGFGERTVVNTNESTESTVVNEPAQKKGRGRPRREAGEEPKAKKPRRDAFAEAFGDKRAGVAVKGLPKGEEKKALVAAVKALSGSSKKAAKLEEKRKRAEIRVQKAQKHLDSIMEAAKEAGAAKAKVEASRARVGSLIQMLYNLAENPLAKPEVI